VEEEFPRLATERSKSSLLKPIQTPVTNMLCRIEVAVKQILSGMNVKTNASVANPEALDWFKKWAERH
jgi:hypothetical protein